MKIILFLTSLIALACGASTTKTETNTVHDNVLVTDTAYFASGCFWCVEAVFESVKGVKDAVSGYAGGSASDANYKQVSAGLTNHAEAVAIYYDAEIISYETLLTVFFDSQDPTTLNRQGPDRGSQYRSEIFYQTEAEKKLSLKKIESVNQSGIWKNEVVTKVSKLDKFYAAEEYHQNYEKRNPNNPYVLGVSVPRLNRFKKKHPDLLKEGH